MPKKGKKKRNPNPHIRWTKSQVQRLKEAVDAYNKNVRRVKRLKGYKDLAPQTEKFKELKLQIGTAKELNRITRQLNKFATIKGRPKIYTNPHGVEMLQWRREKMRSDTLAENRRRLEKTKKLTEGKVYDRDGNLIPNARREQMLNENRLIEAKPETIKSITTFVDLEKNLRRLAYLANPEVQLKRLRDNMITSIEFVLGSEGGKKYINRLNEMTAEELEDFYLENENELDDYFNYRSNMIAEGSTQQFEDVYENKLNEMLGL